MSTGSTIEWTGATWNPVVGCTRVSAGCDNCYAVKQSYRLERMGQEKYAGLTVLNPRGDRHFNGVVRCDESALTIPRGWRKPRRIFVNSMSDLFHAGVPFEFIDRVFAVMALTPQHTYQILTKRPERMAHYMAYAAGYDNLEEEIARQCGWEGSWPKPTEGDWPLPNVWLGTSVENQDAADERIPHLLGCPAAVRFLSCEPLLGPIKLWRRLQDIQHAEVVGYTKASQIAERERPDWVIVGGESGPGARPCDVGWIRSIIGQCKSAGVPCFVKQLGASPYAGGDPSDQGTRYYTNDRKGGDMAEWPEDLWVREWPAERRAAP